MFDNDGDRSLVVADPLFIEIAERNMEGIVPLYYNMKKAGAEIITNESIYNGLITAYSGGAIGVVSNNITKIWNSENVNLDIIKIECLLNNFVIDYAKTLYKPIIPIEVNKMLAEYTKLKVPHFFIYAKDKNKNNVEPINNSVVNRLDRIIPNPKINFNKINLGNFDYKMLKHDKDDTPIDQNIINKYTELDLKKRFIDISSLSENNPTTDLYLYTDIKNKILEVNNDKYYVVDVLIEFLYKEKKSDWKTTLWVCFGDIIIENLKNNIQVKRKYCESCGELIIQSSNRKKYCKKCWKEKRKEKDREYQKKKYDSRRLEKS